MCGNKSPLKCNVCGYTSSLTGKTYIHTSCGNKSPYSTIPSRPESRIGHQPPPPQCQYPWVRSHPWVRSQWRNFSTNTNIHIFEHKCQFTKIWSHCHSVSSVKDLNTKYLKYKTFSSRGIPLKYMNSKILIYTLIRFPDLLKKCSCQSGKLIDT